MWSFDGELSGQPGRSLHLDTQLGRAIIVSYLGYRANGTALFLQASGVRDADESSFVGPLQEFRSGPVIGGRSANGEVAGSPGNIRVAFDTPSSGTVTLPGDVPRRISRFNLNDAASRELPFRESVFSLHANPNESGVVPGSYRVQVKDGTFRMSQVSTTTGVLCTYAGPYQVQAQGLESQGVSTCTDASGVQRQQPYRLERLSVDQLGRVTGSMQQGDSDGILLGICSPDAPALATGPFTCVQGPNFTTVQPGMWAFDEELDGQPGRSLQIDLQNRDSATVVSYVGYRSDGSSLFLQGVSASKFAVRVLYSTPLREYRNGPVIGGAIQAGEEAATLGEMQFEFDSATTGTVTLPSESPRRISRYRYENHATRFDKAYDVVVYPYGRSEGVVTFADIVARDDEFRMDTQVPSTGVNCQYRGAYRLTGEGLTSDGTRTCTDGAGTATTEAYSAEQFTVDGNGILRGVIIEVAGYDARGVAQRRANLYLGSCPGFRKCSPAELDQPR
ncbi:hypothetical protein [Acidovorax sp. WCS2018Cala2-16]|nr:hypothetical protein [Acidovorax sp. WCS2018Cala2-16]